MSALGHRLAIRILLIYCIVELRRERTFADACRVRLDHADHAVDIARGETGADAGAAGRGIGRGHKGIRAEVDVEHRALGALKKDGLSVLLRFVEHRNGVAHVRSKLLLDDLIRGDEFIGVKLIVLDRAAGNIDRIPFIDTLVLEHAEFGVGVVHLFADKIEESFRKHVAATETGTGDLCGVRGADSATGGADLLAGCAGGLFRLVERTMVEHHHLRTRGDEEAAFRLDPGGAESLDLLNEIQGVHHNTIADDANLAIVENSAGDKTQHTLLAFGDNRVTRIGTTLIAHHEIRLIGKNVNNLALAFISPLGTDQNRIHLFLKPLLAVLLALLVKLT